MGDVRGKYALVGPLKGTVIFGVGSEWGAVIFGIAPESGPSFLEGGGEHRKKRGFGAPSFLVCPPSFFFGSARHFSFRCRQKTFWVLSKAFKIPEEGECLGERAENPRTMVEASSSLMSVFGCCEAPCSPPLRKGSF